MKKEEIIKRIENHVTDNWFERREVENIEIESTWLGRLEMTITYKVTEKSKFGDLVNFEEGEFIYWDETGEYEIRYGFNHYTGNFEEDYK